MCGTAGCPQNGTQSVWQRLPESDVGPLRRMLLTASSSTGSSVPSSSLTPSGTTTSMAGSSTLFKISSATVLTQPERWSINSSLTSSLSETIANSAAVSAITPGAPISVSAATLTPSTLISSSTSVLQTSSSIPTSAITSLPTSISSEPSFSSFPWTVPPGAPFPFPYPGEYCTATGICSSWGGPGW